MTEVGPTSQRSSTPPEGVVGSSLEGEDVGGAPPAPSSALQRAARMNAANMLRSMLPLVLLCLVIVWFTALRQAPDERVQTVDPSTTVALAAARAHYPVQAPTGLAGYRVTSARTNAGNAAPGAPVTLEIGYLTPKEKYAGFVESDDPGAAPVRTVLDGAARKGTVDIGGTAWTRSTTRRGETALSRTVGTVTLVVTGSAGDAELTEVARSLRPHSG